ncbi:hypothetical protein [Halomonas litopenaei]|uniref:hypothetical protein n=1 Tax=Halomonas litopenaei TaxID=2109328 RepID=UPI003F9FFF24
MNWLIELMGGPDNAQALGAIFSAITAVVAVIIAIWNGYITRQEARFSVAPTLSMWANYPEVDHPVCQIHLSNKGFGPAIVQSFQVFSDGNPVGGPMFDKVSNLIKGVFGDYLDEVDHVSSLDRGHAFGANDEVIIAKFRVSPELARCGTDGMTQFMVRLSLVVRYQDIYRRDWVFVTHQFQGYTFRDSKWRLSYWKARLSLGKVVTIVPRGPLEDARVL